MDSQILITPMPEDRGMILSFARHLAKHAVKQLMRGEGRRMTLVPPREITAKAQEYLAQHPELYRQAARVVAQHPEWRPRRKRNRAV
jgi:hypothetical protein